MNRFNTKTIISLFLSVILVTGTIAISSSFMIREAQAQPYYGVDNNYKKSKESSSNSISLNKIKCINDNINVNGENSGDFNIGNNGKVANSTEEKGYSSVYSSGGYGGEGYNYMKDRGFDCTINNNNPNTNVVVVDGGNQTIPEPPEPNPILTVNKEMFICNEPDIRTIAIGAGFEFFKISCRDDSGTIPSPDSAVWVSWNDCTENNFCPFFDEEDFTIQIEQNPGPNFIRYEFPGQSDGRSVNVESGTYQITEEVSPMFQCSNAADYEDGAVNIVDGSQTQSTPQGNFCFTLEGDCSDTIQPGEEKACTVKNYLDIGEFAVPLGG